MIPYFQIIQIGPINVWGFFVGLGILTAVFLAYAIRKDERIFDLAFYSVLAALFGGRLFGLFEHPGDFFSDPLEFFRVWEGGMAISGGIFFGIFMGVIYARYKRLPIMEYANLVAFVFPLGEGIGRIGCFLIFDHPGSATNFFLGQMYSDGVIRHNLGLYLSIHGFFLFGIFMLLRRGRIFYERFSVFAPLFLIEYGALRFFTDFLRILDTHYFSLTIAQWSGLIFIFLGVMLLFFKKKK